MSYGFDSRVRYSEVDENGKLTVGSLVNYFQDASSFQSEDLGIGVAFMKERKMAWILSSWQIVIDRMPRLGEWVCAQTWPYEFRGFYGMRNFALLDENRQMLAKANSVWVQYDMEKQRPIRCPEEVVSKYSLEKRLDMEYAPRKIKFPEQGEKQTPFLVGTQMLDTNRHVNNGQYIALAGAYLPEDFEIRELRAEYRMQAYLHDVMVPFVSRLEDRITVSLCSEEEKPYAIVEFYP